MVNIAVILAIIVFAIYIEKIKLSNNQDDDYIEYLKLNELTEEHKKEIVGITGCSNCIEENHKNCITKHHEGCDNSCFSLFLCCSTGGFIGNMTEKEKRNVEEEIDYVNKSNYCDHCGNKIKNGPDGYNQSSVLRNIRQSWILKEVSEW